MPALLVVDMFHGTDVTSFADAKNAGLVGIIHKASQGATSADSRYAQRRDPARQAGLCGAPIISPPANRSMRRSRIS